LVARPSGADLAFRSVSFGSGIVVLALMTTVGLFLTVRAVQALEVAGPSFLTEKSWEPDGGHFGIAAVLLGTILIGTVAVFFALPIALGTALFISEYAPRRIERALITLVDLMAAVPSVVFGLWGMFFLQNHIYVVSKFLSTWFGWTGVLAVPGAHPDNPLDTITQYKSSTFIAGLVVALMITPIMCSVMREAFSQAPIGEREAALGLGATKWGMVRAVVLPFGKGAVIGGTMLGLGRALGETIAVYMILSTIIDIQPYILKSGGSSVSILIAQRVGDASDFGRSALMAAGLALFVLTLVINFGAASVVARSRSGAESN
jgi:phosphate transport system permease protein